MRDVTVE